ncbi:hypothetical protein O6H91_Y265600 [Diphasiastrum complanatum]|nr:hypothetical protein O6H91_Y265600 [Diphasiastrum complanatum]
MGGGNDEYEHFQHSHHHHHGLHEGHYDDGRGRDEGTPSYDARHRAPEHYEEPTLEGSLVKIYCESRPDYYLTVRSEGVVLAPGDDSNIHQQWIKDQKWSTRVKDEAGFPAFSLVNKATRLALWHGKEMNEQVSLQTYDSNTLDESILWSQSADVGNGYQCIRPVGNIHLNLDANHGDSKNGGIEERTDLILFKWKKQENQKWKIMPICKFLTLSQSC